MERYYRKHEENVAKQTAYRKRVKDACYAAYGGYKCSCCGEQEESFLCLDHINNDGYAHRKQIGHRGGIGIYLWIIRNQFPPCFQVLCYNCNQGKRLHNGVCPHQIKSHKDETNG